MAHPQSSFRGLWAKNRIDVGAQQITANSTALLFNGGIRLNGQANAVVTGNSTGIVVVGGAKLGAQTLTANSTTLIASGPIKVSNKQTLTGNSTGIVFGDPASALPGNVDNGVLIGVGSNSTGVFLFVNTTGTTHKYLNVTTAQPT